VLTVHRAQFVEPRLFELAQVARVAGRALAPGVAGAVQLALAAVEAPARAQLFLAPVPVAGLGALARRLSARGHRARAGHAVSVAHARLTVLALESRGTRARAVRVQHSLVLAYVPQRFVRYQFRHRFRSQHDVLLGK